jgi:hypothetical protein
LKERWINRQLPLYDEFSNRELNQQYARERRNNQIRNQVIGAPQPILIDPKEYVIKSRSGWRGYDTHSASYFENCIQYGDALHFDDFKHMIIVDQTSRAVNIITSVGNLITAGEKIALGETQWIQLFLQFARDYLPL